MTQPSLFVSPSSPRRPSVDETRDRILARLARDAGHRFRERAAAVVLETLAQYPQTGCAGEFLVMRCRTAGIVPPKQMDDRAFGPIFMRLARRGLIAKVGTVRRERGHGTAGGNVWALTEGDES